MCSTNQIVGTDHTAGRASPATIEALNGELADCHQDSSRSALWRWTGKDLWRSVMR